MGREFDDGFTDFVVKWSPALLRVAFLLTSDRGEAEDLLQTALLKTSRHWSRLDDREAAYPYVRRVLVTTHTSWRRRRRVHEVLIDRLPERAADEPAGIEVGRALQALEQSRSAHSYGSGPGCVRACRSRQREARRDRSRHREDIGAPRRYSPR